MTTNSTKATPAIAAEIDGTALTLTFADGGTLILDADMTSSEVRMRAMMHGFKQKLVDAAAISRNTDTGRAATIADKRAAVEEVYARLLAGEWNKNREGSGVGAGGLLFAAVCRLYPAKSAEELKAWLDTKSKEQQAALRTNPKIAPIIAAIKLERTKDAPDSDELLNELGE